MATLLVVIATSIVGGLAAVCYYYYCYYYNNKSTEYDNIHLDNNNSNNNNNNDNNNIVQVKLLPEESGLLSVVPSVASITFFQGIIDQDRLHDKIMAIMFLNPWLGGRLVRTGKSAYLRYNKCGGEDDGLVLSRVKRNDLHEKLPYVEIRNIATLYMCKSGSASINKNEPIFKVVVIVTGPNSCALVVSLSHVVGDASSMHAVYRMLSDDQPIVALHPERIMEQVTKEDEVVSRCYYEHLKLMQSISLIVGLMVVNFLFPKHVTMIHFKQEWIDQEKRKVGSSSSAAAAATPATTDNATDANHADPGSAPSNVEPSFVSTNDILTSWILRLFEADLASLVPSCNSVS